MLGRCINLFQFFALIFLFLPVAMLGSFKFYLICPMKFRFYNRHLAQQQAIVVSRVLSVHMVRKANFGICVVWSTHITWKHV